MEFSALQHKDHCPRGMYVIPSTESILLWDAVLFVHQGELRRTYDFVAVTVDASLAGYYADSVLKFRINFPADYPARSPSVTFLTDVFHPLISQQDGQLNLAPRFPRWMFVAYFLLLCLSTNSALIASPKHNHVFDILHWVKLLFKKDVLDGLKEADCVNKEAFR